MRQKTWYLEATNMAVASACPRSSFLSGANCSCSEEPLQRREETAVTGGPVGHCASTAGRFTGTEARLWIQTQVRVEGAGQQNGKVAEPGNLKPECHYRMTSSTLVSRSRGQTSVSGFWVSSECLYLQSWLDDQTLPPGSHYCTAS